MLYPSALHKSSARDAVARSSTLLSASVCPSTPLSCATTHWRAGSSAAGSSDASSPMSSSVPTTAAPPPESGARSRSPSSRFAVHAHPLAAANSSRPRRHSKPPPSPSPPPRPATSASSTAASAARPAARRARPAAAGVVGEEGESVLARAPLGRGGAADADAEEARGDGGEGGEPLRVSGRRASCHGAGQPQQSAAMSAGSA